MAMSQQVTVVWFYGLFMCKFSAYLQGKYTADTTRLPRAWRFQLFFFCFFFCFRQSRFLCTVARSTNRVFQLKISMPNVTSDEFRLVGAKLF